MRYNIILASLTTVILISCQNMSPDKNNTSKPDSSLAKKIDLKTKQPDSIINHLCSQIVLRCIDNCDKEKNSNLKKNGNLPFRIRKTTSNDSTLISFNFISDCCQNFVKDIKISSDTLFLDYKPNSNEICECYCEYSYQFAISKCKWETIFLKKYIIK